MCVIGREPKAVVLYSHITKIITNIGLVGFSNSIISYGQICNFDRWCCWELYEDYVWIPSMLYMSAECWTHIIIFLWWWYNIEPILVYWLNVCGDAYTIVACRWWWWWWWMLRDHREIFNCYIACCWCIQVEPEILIFCIIYEFKMITLNLHILFITILFYERLY